MKDGFGVTGSSKTGSVSGTTGVVGIVGGFVTIVGGATTSGSGSGKSTVSRTEGRVGLNEGAGVGVIVGVTGVEVSTVEGFVFITGEVTTSGSGSGKSIYSSTDGFVNEGPGFVGSIIGSGSGSGVTTGKF